jgi:pimeloyl-ACP methyl ester carboxylesterase
MRSRAFALCVATSGGFGLGAGACDAPPASLPRSTAPSTSAQSPLPVRPIPSSPVSSDLRDASPARPKLDAADPLVALEVPGYGAAVVSLPVGATTPKPVLIAAHGNYDRPEWQCATWRSILGNRGFVLCPRGVARRDSPSPNDIRFTYANASAFTAELDAALAALRSRYADFVDPGPLMYAGFSLGAILGVSYVLRDPSRFPRVVLIEGGEGGWGEAKLAAAGGQRVLWGCGQAGCVGGAKALAARFERAKVPSRVVYGKGEGHSYTGAVADEIKKELPWLIEGDERWALP